VTEHGADPSRSSPPSVPRVATFFALYPETLGLNDGTTFCVAIQTPLRGFAKTAMHLMEGQSPFWLDPRLSQTLAVSVRFHRGQRDRHVFEEHDQKLLPIVQSAAGGSSLRTRSSEDQPERSQAHDDSFGTAYTVVEMTTQLAIPREGLFEACEPSGEVMGPTLTRCIDGLILVVDAFRSTQDVFIAPAARERLGPEIMATTRAADPDEGGWDEPAEYYLNAFATKSRYFIAGTQTSQTLPAMAHHIRLAARGYPPLVVGNLQADLDNALFSNGDFRAVLMFAYSASEILMDLALMAMLFEEGKTAQMAAASFTSPLKTRILTDYHDRLGGSWGPKGSGAVATWLQHVLLVRHQVAHGGYMPHYERAYAAREAHYNLGQHLRDRLAARAKRYPFTAGLLVTPPGFERRGIRTKAAGTAVHIGNDRIDEFIMWQNELIKLRA